MVMSFMLFSIQLMIYIKHPRGMNNEMFKMLYTICRILSEVPFILPNCKCVTTSPDLDPGSLLIIVINMIIPRYTAIVKRRNTFFLLILFNLDNTKPGNNTMSAEISTTSMMSENKTPSICSRISNKKLWLFILNLRQFRILLLCQIIRIEGNPLLHLPISSLSNQNPGTGTYFSFSVYQILYVSFSLSHAYNIAVALEKLYVEP